MEVIKSTTTSGGENAENARKSMKAVRRMMPPLVPEELVTPQLVELIIAASFNGYTEIPLDVKAFGNYVLRIYVGKHHPRSRASTGPRYPLALWNVSVMTSRTNNAAESVHAQMNPQVNGKVSVFEFLSTIEKQMAKTNDRVANGCKPETKAIELVKSGLLAHGLHKLLNGEQGVVNFLDNCVSIVKMKSVAESKAFVPQTSLLPRTRNGFQTIVSRWLLPQKIFIADCVLVVRWLMMMFWKTSHHGLSKILKILLFMLQRSKQNSHW